MSVNGIFPAPSGPCASFSNLQPGVDTPIFSWAEVGHYIITWEAIDPNNPGTLVLNTNVAGTSNGTDTAVLTMVKPGAYDYVIASPGVVNFNFNASLGANRATMTQMKGGVL